MLVNFNEILLKIQQFPYKKINLNMSSAVWWPFCLSFNVLIAKETLWNFVMINVHINGQPILGASTSDTMMIKSGTRGIYVHATDTAMM